MPLQWMWLDWIFIAIIALSTIIAWFRGFIREALSLITWVLSVVLGLHFANALGFIVFSMITNPTLRFGVSFLSIFFVVLIIGMIINFVLSKLIKGSGLGFFDALLGALFGFLRGGCIVLVIIMFLAMPWIGAGALLDRSVIATIAHPLVNWTMSYVPSEDAISKNMQTVLDNSNQLVSNAIPKSKA